MRVLIADDHTMVRESLVSVLQADGDVQVVAQAADGIDAVEKAHRSCGPTSSSSTCRCRD